MVVVWEFYCGFRLLCEICSCGYLECFTTILRSVLYSPLSEVQFDAKKLALCSAIFNEVREKTSVVIMTWDHARNLR